MTFRQPTKLRKWGHRPTSAAFHRSGRFVRHPGATGRGASAPGPTFGDRARPVQPSVPQPCPQVLAFDAAVVSLPRGPVSMERSPVVGGGQAGRTAGEPRPAAFPDAMPCEQASGTDATWSSMSQGRLLQPATQDGRPPAQQDNDMHVRCAAFLATVQRFAAAVLRAARMFALDSPIPELIDRPDHTWPPAITTPRPGRGYSLSV